MEQTSATSAIPARTVTRKTFTKEQDTMLRHVVDVYGSQNWAAVAGELIGFNTRQVKDRYNNYVSPNINISPWTHEENVKLVALVLEKGHTWTSFMRHFDRRTAVNIKNHWSSLKDKLEAVWKERFRQLYPNLPVPESILKLIKNSKKKVARAATERIIYPVPLLNHFPARTPPPPPPPLPPPPLVFENNGVDMSIFELDETTYDWSNPEFDDGIFSFSLF